MINFEDKLKGMNSVGISGHVRPDGDCVGSTMAVYNYITTYHPEISVDIYLESIPNVFRFLKNTDKIQETAEDKVYDLFIVLDCGDKERLGSNAKYYELAKHTLCIDHHASNQAFAEDNYIIPDASSTCELVFHMMDTDKITKEIAECLYTGIVHDTGVFQYSCTSAQTMNTVGILMEKGINYPKIVDDTFYTKTYNQNRILGYALLNSKLYLDGKVILTYLTKETMQEFECTPKELDGIVNQLRVTKDTVVAVFLYESEDGSYKASFRVNGEFNVAEIALVFGGGGHIKAAGCNLFGPIDEVIGRILAEIEKRL
ncbi:MAG: bifunctional oligoribonuclease/PAP phosphatase NrnA [Agathobacter sp.]|nr:bifunctional oligoribonuclease/PAP phosphatase NrnA [Agathobacter sp.]